MRYSVQKLTPAGTSVTLTTTGSEVSAIRNASYRKLTHPKDVYRVVDANGRLIFQA